MALERKVVLVSTGVRKQGNTYASSTAMLFMIVVVTVTLNPNTTNQPIKKIVGIIKWALFVLAEYKTTSWNHWIQSSFYGVGEKTREINKSLSITSDLPYHQGDSGNSSICQG